MKTDPLSITFAALADPTRRAILGRLAEGEATVNELAAPHAMSLPSVSRHLKVLERAGLVVKGRSAQWRPCRLEAAPLNEADAWMAPYRDFFETRFGAARAAIDEGTTTGGIMTDTEPTPREFTLTWTLDASPAEVFRAWTDPEHLQWFYNDNNPIPPDPIELDLRVGGAWRQRMVISETTNYITGGVYREIVSDEKLVFTWGAVGGWPELDLDRLDESPLVVVTLTPIGEGTEMRVRVELPESLSEEGVREWFAMGIRDGMRQTVDRLAAALRSTSAAV